MSDLTIEKLQFWYIDICQILDFYKGRSFVGEIKKDLAQLKADVYKIGLDLYDYDLSIMK